MAKKHQEPEPEPVERDLPEPKEEPVVKATVHTDPVFHNVVVTFEHGEKTHCRLLYVDRRGRDATQSFDLIATGGPSGAEVRVIGASNVTIG